MPSLHVSLRSVLLDSLHNVFVNRDELNVCCGRDVDIDVDFGHVSHGVIQVLSSE